LIGAIWRIKLVITENLAAYQSPQQIGLRRQIRLQIRRSARRNLTHFELLLSDPQVSQREGKGWRNDLAMVFHQYLQREIDHKAVLPHLPVMPTSMRKIAQFICLMTPLSVVLSSCTTTPKPPMRGQIVQPPSDLSLSASTPKTPPPPVFAESVLVVDMATNRNLYAKNADQKRAVASTQKIITALCVLDAGSLDKVVTIAASDGNCEPTKLYLKPGEQYTRRELLKVLMVKSANDVSRALARDVGGSVEGFAVLMNRKCQQLGMRNSHFINPNGLTEPGQYSTARDMAIAARMAYRSPTLRSFSNTESYFFKYSDGRMVEIENTNKLLKKVSFINGLKTGTTNASGRCLISTAEYDGRAVVCVVLKSNTANIWSDSEKLIRWALDQPTAE
jgi:serine-type D-Ala-D-Ala carboxypeptidase (penicillin-binding protein 5/6)